MADYAGVAVRFLSLTAVLLGLFWILFADSTPLSALVTNTGVFFYGDTTATNQGVMRARTFSPPSTAGTEFDGATASSTSFILWTTAKTAPTREEMMVGGLKVDGTLDIQTCTTGCDANADFTARWNNAGTTATQDCDDIPTTDTCVRAYDIGYEALSGRGFVAYGDNVADNFYYARWDGSAWSPNTTPGTPGVSNAVGLPGTAGTPQWIRVIPAGENLGTDRSNRVIVLVSDTNDDLHAFYWDGSAFDSGTSIVTDLENCSNVQCFDGSWQDNTTFVVTYGDADAVNDVKYRAYTVGTGWGAETTAFTTAAAPLWIVSTTDPTSTRILASAVTTGDDAINAVWRGDNVTNGWTTGCSDTSIESVSGMEAYAVFERFNGEGLHIFNNAATNASSPDYCTYTPTATWGAVTAATVTSGDDIHKIKAWGSPNSDDALMVIEDVDCDTDAQHWTGSAWSTAIASIEVENSNYGVACPNENSPGTAPSGIAYNYDFSWLFHSPWQRNWRFYDGADTASVPTTALAAENTAPTGFVISGGVFRLRANYAERGTLSSTDSRRKLQYTSGCNPNSVLASTCTWTDVDDAGGAGIWRYIDPTCTATDCADGTVLTGTVLTGSGTCSAGNGCGTWVLDKDAAANANMDHNGSTIQESEWIVESNNTATTTTYYFRIWDIDQQTPVYPEADASDCGGGAAACTYPTLTTGTIPPPTMDQVMRHGNWFSNGLERYFYWAE